MVRALLGRSYNSAMGYRVYMDHNGDAEGVACYSFEHHDFHCIYFCLSLFSSLILSIEIAHIAHLLSSDQQKDQRLIV